MHNHEQDKDFIKAELTDSGKEGPAGKDGTSVWYGEPYDTLADLETAIPVGESGEMHIIGGNAIYAWSLRGNLWVYISPWNSGQLPPDIEAVIRALVLQYSDLNWKLGDLIPNISTVEPEGRKFANGQRLANAQVLLPEFWQYVSTKTPYKTLAQYNNIINQYGQCGFCAIDGADIVLPTITRPISGVENIGQIGTAIIDTMRPITGAAHNNIQGHSGWGGQSEGALEWMEGRGDASWEDNTWGYAGIKLDTSKLGANYNGSETRGKQIMYPYCIVVQRSQFNGVGIADRDLGNLSATGEAKLQAIEDNAKAYTDTKVSAEASRATTAENTLQTNINAEEASREHVDAGLNELISNEASRAQTAEAALDSAKINKSAVPLGTSGPTNNKRTLLQAITIDVISAVSAFISGWSTDVESDGAADIETQVALPIVDDSHAGLMPAADHNQIITNTGAIAAEITRATGKENDLQNAIDDEASDRATAVSGEASARGTAITGEATARASADTTLQSNITAEATARANADATLQGNIDAEASRATTAESTLDSNKLNKTDIVDNLTSSATDKALSANMGRELKGQIDTVAENGQNRGTYASIAALPSPNSGDYAYLSDISAQDAANTSVFPNGAAAGDTWRVDEANPSGDGATFVWIGTIRVNEAQRDFTADPILAGELAAGAATDTNIGTRALTDAAADSTLVPVAAKALTAWLQGIRNNLKALLAFMSRAAGFATSAQGTKADSAVQDGAYVHTDSNYTAAEKTKLAGIAAGAEVNIQPDWTQTSTSAKDYIKNKPVIPEGAGQATNTTLGVVKGSTAAGQAYVETDGTLSLNGYDALTTGLGNANTAIAGKVDKITTASRIYSTSSSGEPSSLAFTTGTAGDAIVRRHPNGDTWVLATPPDYNSATSKEYVDNSVAGRVPTARTVNGKALSADITLTKEDVGLGNVANVAAIPQTTDIIGMAIAADDAAAKAYSDAHPGIITYGYED